jgi:hypothetical protein
MEIVLKELNVKEFKWKHGKELKVVIDHYIWPEFEEEANVRDLVRKIQDERKRLGLNLTQKTNVSIEKMPTDTKLVQWMVKKAQIADLRKGKFKVTKSS